MSRAQINKAGRFFGTIACLLGVASCSTGPALASVSNDHIEFAGSTYQNVDTFYIALVASSAQNVNFTFAPGTDYAHVSAALAALRKSAKAGPFIVGNVAPSDEPPAVMP